MRIIVGSVLAGLWLCACSASAPVDNLQGVQSFVQTQAALSRLSCSEKAKTRDTADFFNIKIESVDLGSEAHVSAALPEGVRFAGGWHLTSTESDFGGLSGAVHLVTEEPSPNPAYGTMFHEEFLAVSDKGIFFVIDFADGAPTNIGQKVVMLDKDGRSLRGKIRGDAEGLAVGNGIAFVSFEQRHRILAYTLGECGVTGRGISFAQIPDQIDGKGVERNQGAEALDYIPSQGIIAGYETAVNGAAPLVNFGPNGQPLGETSYLPMPEDFKLVGLSRGTQLLRRYDPTRGNRNIIRLSDGREIRLDPPLATDNFEGITDSRTEDGTRRIYIISDDNFSDRQRTLLYAFDVD